MIVKSRRERYRESVSQEIKDVARQQIAAQGAAALSLRAIANQMEMNVTSLYNYYKNRDELVTALLVDAFNSVADVVETASNSSPTHDYGSPILASLIAYREWALAHHAEYALIAGNPIPGYHAPAEITTRPAQRATFHFLKLLQAAWQHQQLNIPSEYVQLPPNLYRELNEWSYHQELKVPLELIPLALTLWGQLHGLVSLEINNHTFNIVNDGEALFRFQMLNLLKHLGLPPIS